MFSCCLTLLRMLRPEKDVVEDTESLRLLLHMEDAAGGGGNSLVSWNGLCVSVYSVVHQ